MYKDILSDLYTSYRLEDKFHQEYLYLKDCIEEIDQLWMDNISKVEKVKLVLLAEAPLWGKQKRYFYNPKSEHSQFFFHNDLSEITSRPVSNKSDLIRMANSLGIVILDFSPFPFNPQNTSLSYKKDNISLQLKKSDYKNILIKTADNHFLHKLEILKSKNKISETVSFCYRYERVKTELGFLINNMIVKSGFAPGRIKACVTMSGGGIDRHKLSEIYNAP